MRNISTNQIRREFLGFFENDRHVVVKASPLIPHNDPSLMFTNAGMVQFKDYLTGLNTPNFKRAVTCQKCVRAGGKHNDLDNVGYTARHHTFFEMLGNFSFGDYFKEHAIEMAWKFLTSVLSLPTDRLYITVYHTDEEAASLWKKMTGCNEDRIIKISTDDNLWSMGATGPYGPCSEIFYDHGSQYCGGLPGTCDADGDRYVEIWNLVFMQYEKMADGTTRSIPKPSIDTGMGIERIAAVMQGVHNNFDIDIFQQLIHSSMMLSGNTSDITAHRVIADHLRSAAFLIADGVMPSNEKRGYVLRRIIRRAVRYVHQMGCTKPLLYSMVPELVDVMGEQYPELVRMEVVIADVLRNEETRFKSTIANGMHLLDHQISKMQKGGKLDGATAFKLYDTYGFPLDLTKDLLLQRGISVDEEQFDSAMAAQRSQSIWCGSGDKAEEKIWFDIYDKCGPTEFMGYAMDSVEAVVVAIVSGGCLVRELARGEEGCVILNQTPFYGEMGGQIGDTGCFGPHTVSDTKIVAGGKIFAHTVAASCALKVGDTGIAKIDSVRRGKIRANHSATHILNEALRVTIGQCVVQSGSYVDDSKLRFDFSHDKALTEEEIFAVEDFVNDKIVSNCEISTTVMSYEQAISAGAISLLGEKYTDDVRVVSIGVASELCGGIHARRTGDIGMFRIVCEESIAAGVRRIEARTGLAALRTCRKDSKVVKDISNVLQCSGEVLSGRVEQLLSEKRVLSKSLEEHKIRLISLQGEEKVNEMQNGEVLVFCDVADFGLDSSYVRKVVDAMGGKYAHMRAVMVVVAGTDTICDSVEDSTSYIMAVRVTAGSVAHSAEIIKRVIAQFGGKGGGSKELAQAGGIVLKKGRSHDILRAFGVIEQNSGVHHPCP